MRIRSARELALVISSRRKKLNLTQKTAGELVGLLQKTISAFENRPENTKLDTLFRILSVTGLEIQVLPKEAKKGAEEKWNQEW
jgi:HTH-type transcriptional regulator/antitoxin HipB